MPEIAVRFVTNRPTNAGLAGGFGPLPDARPTDPLQFGVGVVDATTDPGSPGTVKSATAVGADPSLSGPLSAELLAFLASFLQSAAAQDAQPLLMIHGYNNLFTQALTSTANLAALIGTAAPPVRLAPLLFSWPSIGGVSVDSYQADRGRAQRSGPALARLLATLAQAWTENGRPVMHLLAHSMGNWVLDNGLLVLAAGPSMPAEPLFAQAVVMAGDDDSTAFSPGGGLRLLGQLAQWVSIGINKTDGVVAIDEKFIFGHHRLADDGPADPAGLPPNIRVVDYTMAIAGANLPTPPGETTWSYKLHNYYRTVPRVRADLAQIFRNLPPSAISDRTQFAGTFIPDPFTALA